MQIRRRQLLCLAAISHFSLMLSQPAFAQEWPSRAIRIIVVASAGGLPDIAARTFAQPLSKAFGQPVVVENRAGGAGNIATEMVARAAPDGYTLLSTGANQAVNQILYPKPGFDYEKDLAPVAMLAESNMMVVASPTFPANNLQETLDLARKKPGTVSMSVSVLGSPNHMGAELLAAMGKVELNFIVYKGISAALPDLMSGNVDVGIGALSSVLPQVKAGRLKALAVTRPKRTPQAPDVPTADESGLAGFDINTWIAMMATGGTSPAILERIASDVRRIAQTAEVRSAFDKQGIEASSMLPHELGAYIRREVQTWTPVLKNARIKAQ